ncbi:MAG: hypothetical protein LBH92_07190 [Bacteroidales bacterium]|jgi:hypothetical protein|nr:hypothetical protein [Bacteroidales bacterium]
MDFESLQAAFHKWTKAYVRIDESEWVSIDRKCIRSTVSDYSNEYQNFVSLVSLFFRKRKQILRVGKIENKKSSKTQAVNYLKDNVADSDYFSTRWVTHFTAAVAVLVSYLISPTSLV